VLTGTPVPNGYEDLYNLFQFLYPFQIQRHSKTSSIKLGDMTKNCGPNDDRVKEFTNNISPYFIRIKKEDLKLPPVQEQTIEVKMDSEQREIYDFIETKYVKSFQKDGSASIKDFLNRARLIRLRQAATNPSLLLKPIAEAFDRDDDQSMPDISGHLPDEFQDDSFIISKIAYYSNSRPRKSFAEIKTYLNQILPSANGKSVVLKLIRQMSADVWHRLIIIASNASAIGFSNKEGFVAACRNRMSLARFKKIFDAGRTVFLEGLHIFRSIKS